MLEQLFHFISIVTVAIGAIILMILSNKPSMNLNRLNLITVLFLSVSILFELFHFRVSEVTYLYPQLFGKMFIVDNFSNIFDLMFTIGALMTLLINSAYFQRRKYFNGEYFSLILFSVFGMMMLAHSNELITIFISLEIASLTVYALVGYHKQNFISSEAMMKYMVLGAMMSALFILGSTLIYGAVGSTNLGDISAFIATHQNDLTLVYVGGTLIFVTILFKIGAVPFHAWVLDVYHGAPYPVTMFMASTFKIAVFAIALRIYLIEFASIANMWTSMLQIITIFTLIGGSLLAISQNVVKRMLAGSSIVHSGYMLIALSSVGLGSNVAAPAIMFYLITYFLSSVGAFGILSYIASESKKQMTYEDFKGFSERRPYLSIMMAIFMLSLSGFPSTIGFLGKFYIFTSAIQSGQILLAGLGIVTAFISVYYYFKLIAMMYFYPTGESAVKFSANLSTLLIALMALIIVWGGIGTTLIPFFPGADNFIDMAHRAIASLYLK